MQFENEWVIRCKYVGNSGKLHIFLLLTVWKLLTFCDVCCVVNWIFGPVTTISDDCCGGGDWMYVPVAVVANCWKFVLPSWLNWLKPVTFCWNCAGICDINWPFRPFGIWICARFPFNWICAMLRPMIWPPLIAAICCGPCDVSPCNWFNGFVFWAFIPCKFCWIKFDCDETINVGVAVANCICPFALTIRSNCWGCCGVWICGRELCITAICGVGGLKINWTPESIRMRQEKQTKWKQLIKEWILSPLDD